MCPQRAYPRSRGATALSLVLRTPGTGLSPLARGNLARAVRALLGRRPIPARAGQPTAWPCMSHGMWAYPRSRGATADCVEDRSPPKGLSPLARGNLPPVGRCCLDEGPIPARAGQPRRHHRPGCGEGAYPRSRGATASRICGVHTAGGLSPLARGNPRRDHGKQPGRGPIPARAGQPGSSMSSVTKTSAYPRSRGATSCN